MSLRRVDLRRQLDALAYRQAGYFSAAQAREIGYSYQAQKYHVDVGNWVRIDRGLFRLPTWPSAPDDQYVRWTLWSGARGTISHESALRVHDLSDVDPARIHLTVLPGVRIADPLVVLHHDDVPESEVEQRQAWRVTTPLRTLIDVAAGDLSQEQLNQAMSDALERGLVTRRAVLRSSAELSERPALRLERALANEGRR